VPVLNAGKVAMTAFCMGTVAALVMFINEVNAVQLLALIVVPDKLQNSQIKEINDVQPVALMEFKAARLSQFKVCKPVRPLTSIEVRVGLLPLRVIAFFEWEP